MTLGHKPHTVEELTKRDVETIARLEKIAQADRPKSDHIADAITRFCGSMAFVGASFRILDLDGAGFSHTRPFKLLCVRQS